MLIFQAKAITTVLGTDAKTDTFTIKAIGQDDFSDVPMPDAPSQPAHTPNASVIKSAGKA